MIIKLQFYEQKSIEKAIKILTLLIGGIIQ